MKKLVRTLLVEDDPGSTLAIRTLLESAPCFDFKVANVRSCREAKVLLSHNRVDLIVLDIGLPNGQGIATARAVREAAGDTPVVVYTGSDNAEVAYVSLTTGLAQEYLMKGTNPKEVLERIRFTVMRDMALRETRAVFADSKKLMNKQVALLQQREADPTSPPFNAAKESINAAEDTIEGK